MSFAAALEHHGLISGIGPYVTSVGQTRLCPNQTIHDPESAGSVNLEEYYNQIGWGDYPSAAYFGSGGKLRRSELSLDHNGLTGSQEASVMSSLGLCTRRLLSLGTCPSMRLRTFHLTS